MEYDKNEKWGLNTPYENLTYRQRRDAFVLLYFLNEYKDQNTAFERLKKHWTNIIYKLPKTSEKRYNSVKNGRYTVYNRMKKLFEEHVVEL
ncbi:hypothetical protein [Gaetbulibacter aestuarii]|uniref:Uncharacterized protein n=1 Tax=Gaetbulibacter aestuarii TaxID=1502358 RepID=A0ABW7N200_9FLAO